MLSSKEYLIYLFERICSETGVPLVGEITPAEIDEPPTKEHTIRGKIIADKAGLEYGGWWKDLNAWWFNEPITHSTIVARNVGEAILKKDKLLIAYELKHPKVLEPVEA